MYQRCVPGPYLQSKFPWIAEQVNQRLGIVDNKKSIAEIAQEVILGKWGNGLDRENRLISAGYDYNDVQNMVNTLISGSAIVSTKSLDKIAKEVIQGKWDNGSIRKQKLEAAGYNYAEVQKKVNELLG